MQKIEISYYYFVKFIYITARINTIKRVGCKLFLFQSSLTCTPALSVLTVRPKKGMDVYRLLIIVIAIVLLYVIDGRYHILANSHKTQKLKYHYYTSD